MDFKSVVEYYGYMTQGNCFAPKFEDLRESTRMYWAREFEKYKNEQNDRSESK